MVSTTASTSEDLPQPTEQDIVAVATTDSAPSAPSEIETPVQGQELRIFPLFNENLVEKDLAPYVKDPWNSAAGVAYRLAAARKDDKGEPSPFAKIYFTGGFSDLKERLAKSTGAGLRDLIQDILASVATDQILIGQLAMLRLGTFADGQTVESFERLAAIKLKADEAAVKTLSVVEKLRSPVSLSIKTAQLNFAGQQVVNNSIDGPSAVDASVSGTGAPMGRTPSHASAYPPGEVG